MKKIVYFAPLFLLVGCAHDNETTTPVVSNPPSHPTTGGPCGDGTVLHGNEKCK